MATAYEAYARAVRILATDPGRIQERLKRAYVKASSAPLDDPREDVGDHAREAIRLLHAVMTRVPGPEGTVAATVDAMTEDEAREAAERILSIAYELRRP
jgi:hypothetical protein